MSPSTCTTSIPGNDFGVAAPAVSGTATTAAAITPSAQTQERPHDGRPGTGRVSSVADRHQHSRSMQGMELAQFCSTSRVVIVAGKGGVGKTTVTATLAVAAARTGMSVLIVEVEGKSGLAAAFDRPALTLRRGRARRRDRGPHLDARRRAARLPREPRAEADLEAAACVGRARRGRDRGSRHEGHPRARQGEEPRAGPRTADLIVLDAPAAGHAITFLLSARGLLDAVRVGPVRKQAQDVVELLSDPARCQVRARDDPGGDAGQRADRHRVRDRGPGRRARSVRSSSTVATNRRRSASSRRHRTRSRPTPPRSTASSRRGRPTISLAPPSSAPRGTPSSRSRRRGSPSASRFPRCACRSCSAPSSGAPRSTTSPTCSRPASS